MMNEGMKVEMNLSVDVFQASDLLQRTPVVLTAVLYDLPERLLTSNEGDGTWSPFDVLGHLIHGEKTDWIPRTRMILEHGESRPFDPFDREAMFQSSKGKSIDSLLKEFSDLRKENLLKLQEMNLTSEDLGRKGTHPALGTVTLGQLLATWVVHDLDHTAQILRVISKQHDSLVGPWKEYLRILSNRT
jgi:hypothetical protein